MKRRFLKDLKALNSNLPFSTGQGIYLDKSYLTNKHMVWLGVRIRDQIKNYPISAHYKIEDAWIGKEQSEKALKYWLLSYPQKSLYTPENFPKFIDFLNKNFDYESDDYVGLFNRELNGETPVENYKSYPWYVQKFPINPSVEPHLKENFYGNPDDYCKFAAFHEPTKAHLIIYKNQAPWFKTYLMAGMVCDHLNSSDRPVTKNLLDESWEKCNRLQKKF